MVTSRVVSGVVRRSTIMPSSSLGRRLASSSVGAVVDPYTGKRAFEYEILGEAEVMRRAAAARVAQKFWRDVPVADRVAIVDRAMDKIVQRDGVAEAVSAMTGKPLKQAKGELLGMKARARAMSRLAPEALEPTEFADAGRSKRRIVKEPVGTVLCVAPWNYPMMSVVNALVPGLLAGNAVLLKHSPQSPLCAEFFADAFDEAPKGLVQSLNTTNDNVAKVMPEIDFLSFTGSVRGGSQLHSTLASASFANATLELGGKDASFVAADADLKTAAYAIVDGATYNAGQSCCSVERVYVARESYEEFLALLETAMREIKMGNPLDPATTLGPMALPGAPSELQAQVLDATAKGARLLMGGSAEGRFFQPTLLADCDHSMAAMTDESFGPLVAVARVDSEEDAVRMINDSNYGLTASVWTRDLALAERLAPQLQVGTVLMNKCDFVDPLLPWGGRKLTGKGTSLSKFGFDSMVRLKGYHFFTPK